MPRQTLRPYQAETVAAVIDAIENGERRILYTCATGTGKTTIIAELVRVLHELEDMSVLLLAHRSELVTQMAQRVMEHCNYSHNYVGIEQSDRRSHESQQIVVGSVQTCRTEGRLKRKFDCVITDESHHASATSYSVIYDYLGVNTGDCVHIGCTATAKRGDKKSLYARNTDGTPVMLEDPKTKKTFPAKPEDCVFDRLVYNFSILDAIDGGWLVPMHGHRVETKTSLEGIPKSQGDYQIGALSKAIDNEERTLLAISAWKQIAGNRQTIVFCASVGHAHNAAKLWQSAGYIAASLDGTTETAERKNTLDAFKQGHIQVLCNMGLYTEGVDVPEIGCVVLLRPTKVWSLYVQMAGRGARPLPRILEGLDTPELRQEAIAQSAKPDCILLDLVDICEKNDICTAPAILDLPNDLDLQGKSLSAAKEMIERVDEKYLSQELIESPPATFRELEVLIEKIELMQGVRSKFAKGWLATHDGYSFNQLGVGYRATLEPIGDGAYKLKVSHNGATLFEKEGVPRNKFETYLGYSQSRALQIVDEHRSAQSRGTLTRLSPKQTNVLIRNGHSRPQIDAMPYAKAKALIGKYMDEYKARRKPEFDEE